MDESIAVHHNTVAKLYAALLDRAPDASGMNFWATAARNGAGLADIARGLLNAAEVRAAYPADLSAADFVASLYRMLFDRAPDAGGAAFWASALDGRGADSAEGRAWLVLQLLDTASQPLDTRPEGMSEAAYAQTLADRAVLANKAEAGVYFATVLGSDDIALARQMMATVTADPASVQAAIDVAVGVPPDPEPQPVPPPGEPTITSAALTKDAQPVLSGGADAGTTVHVTIGGATYVVTTAGGAWHLDLSSAVPIDGTLVLDENGDNAVSAVAVGAGGTSTAATQTLVIDTTPPQRPIITSAAETHVETPVIAGTAEFGDTVIVNVAGATYTLATVDGAWQLNLATATPTSGALALNTHGLNPVSVVATDAAGNVSSPGTQVLDIDPNHAPQPAITSADTVAVIRQKFADYPGTIAKVAAANLSAEQWTEVAAHLGKVGAGNITGAMVLTAEVPAGDALALLTKYSGTTARLDASVHNLTTLQTLANDARVGVLTGLSLSLADVAMTDALTAALLGKAGGARVDAAGATLQELRTLGNAGYMSDKLADGGVTGTVTIDKELNLAQQLGLLGKLNASAVIAANATNLDAPALKAIAARADQLSDGGIQGRMHLNSQLNASEIGVLIDHFGGTFISAHLSSSMDATVIAKMAANYGKFFGITGDLAMSGDLPIDQVIGLLSKYSGDTATITSPAYAVADLDQLASNTQVSSLVSPTVTIAVAEGGTAAQLGRILTKSQNAIVDNTAGTATILPTLFANLGKIATGGITNWGATDRIALDHDSMDAASFGTFVGKLAADIRFAVDAAQMDADQVVALFANSGKVAALSNLSIPEGAFARMPNDVAPLFMLQVGIHADLTGARSAQLEQVSQFVNHLADNGLTGTFTLTESLSTAALDRLLDKSAVAANVTVDVTRMDADQVNAVLAHLDKADTVIGLAIATDSPLLADPAALESLLGAGSNIAIDLQGASQDVVDVVLGNLQGVANGGLSHADLTLSATQWQALNAAQLAAKLSIDAVVKVQGTAANETLDFTQMTRPFTVDAGAGADTIRLSSGASTVMLGGRADNKAVDFSANTTPPTGIDNLLGVHNGVKLQLSREAGAYIDGVALQAGAAMSPQWTSVTYNAGMTFEDLYLVAKNMNGGVIASTASLVQVRGVQFINGGESHHYLFVNDGTAGIDENDFVVHLVGGGTMTLTV